MKTFIICIVLAASASLCLAELRVSFDKSGKPVVSQETSAQKSVRAVVGVAVTSADAAAEADRASKAADAVAALNNELDALALTKVQTPREITPQFYADAIDVFKAKRAAASTAAEHLALLWQAMFFRMRVDAVIAAGR